MFEDGEEIACQSLFLAAPLRQHSSLFKTLGCEIGSDGLVKVTPQSVTTVSGCYAAGDAVTKHHQLVIAAASGASAAIALSVDLLESEAKALAATRRS